MMIYGKPPRRWPKVLIALVVIVIIVACIWQFACGGLPFLSASEGGQTDSSSEQAQTTDQPSSSDASSSSSSSSADSSSSTTDTKGTYQEGLNTQIKISAVGDCTLGTDIDFDDDTNFTSVYNEKGDSYFFKNVTEFTSSDNLTLANLEGPLTSSSDIQEKSYNFKGPAKYANILVKGSVEAVNLANNHSYDYGTTGYEDTKETLAKYKVTSFGYDRIATTTINGVKVGLFGVNQVTSTDTARSQMKADISTLKDAGCAIIIGMFHWGIEGEYTPDTDQVSLAHGAIDRGCDLVIGSHPHVLQGVERYKNRYICYSMGNFVFGGNDNPDDMDTMIFQQTFNIVNGQLSIDDTTTGSAAIVPCSMSSSSSSNNFQPTPLTGSKASTLLTKVNKYSSKLSGEGVKFSTSVDDSGTARVD
jgi:poly-gamma-glutamate capsule biosynthesis protein CapA/YwtB (metallophosphatase superfamily)